MKKLSQAQKEAYLNGGGTHCPKCKSDHITAIGSIEADGDHAWCTVSCGDCDAQWRDIYRLTAVEDVG